MSSDVATHPSPEEDHFMDQDAATLATKAERCRRLAAGISDKQASEVLRSMAENYERSAARINEGVTSTR
jgi:hypothetical protein